MSLSVEEIIKKQAEQIDQLGVRISELEAENRALHLENAQLKGLFKTGGMRRGRTIALRKYIL